LIFPDLLSYIFYRLECAIRSAAILSFVGIAGIGMQIELALDDLLFGRVWTLLAVLALLILAVDLWSSMVRRRLAS
jgi:phosphonate transport system permease protein